MLQCRRFQVCMSTVAEKRGEGEEDESGLQYNPPGTQWMRENTEG